METEMTNPAPLPFTLDRQGAVLLTVQIVPRASKSEVVGIHGDALKIRIQAPPVDGKANLALREFVAEKLGVAMSAVSLVSGETSRRKVLKIVGVTMEKIKHELILTIYLS